MAISLEHQQADKRVVVPLLKASLIASLTFTLAWAQSSLPFLALRSVSIFIFFGILIAIFSMVVGLPIVLLMIRFRIRQWWVYLLTAAATGALLSALFSSRPTGGIENPHALAFSPWTRDTPGLFDGLPLAWADYVGSVLFGTLIGGVLGISFWYFHFRRAEKGAT